MSNNLKRKLQEENAEEVNSKRVHIGEDNQEEKISRLLSAVLAQGPLGNLVIILQDENENPYVTLQNSVSYLNMIVQVNRNDSNKENFSLMLNGEEFVTGTFQNGQLARRSLAEKALEKLKETCFFIYKKRDYVNVTKENLQTSSSNSSPNGNPVGTGSIAHKIMMKMGWTGGGLGAQGQGSLDSVMLYENVNREGLGKSNLMKEITKQLDNFSKSSDLLTLVFNADFTKDERALIHRVARKFNLKSRSTGTECRKLTVSKKITRIDIVRELLKIGGEDGLYKLHIPSRFAHIWE